MKAWSVTGVCQEPQYYSQTAKCLAYSHELSMAELTQGQPVGDIQEGALYEGISLFTRENGSILLYIVSLLI